MSDLARQLSAAAGAAFEAMGMDASLGAMRRSDRPDLADFQCNGAMIAAKREKKNPREVAQPIADALNASDLVELADVAGPGFINVKVSAKALSAQAAMLAVDERSGAGRVETARRVMVDFGGWNVAKPMHIGHLRSTIIGDSLQRLFRFRGDDVTSDVHLGDWGLQMGLLIVGVKEEQPKLVYFDDGFDGTYPETSPVSMDDLERLYPKYAGMMKEHISGPDGEKIANPEYRAEVRDLARTATAELQEGHPGYRALWTHFCKVTQVGLERECKALGVEFDLWKGESDAQPFIPKLVEDLKAREIAEFDDGAWIVRVARDSDKKEMPPVLLVNRDGASGYHATDLGTILDRKNAQNPELTIYVVDQRQALHFEQVFRAADKAGYLAEDALEHIGFGTMNGKDGKPFKTREGGVLKLHDLIMQAREAASARMAEVAMDDALSSEELTDITQKVAAAAIKFADLSNVRTTNYVFDLERFISFEGKTGPYLLYQAVRMKALKRRAEAEGVEPGEIVVELPEERALVLALDGFDEALAGAYAKRMPHILCDHAYAIAQAFSSFYKAAPILKDGVEGAQRGSRFALALATLKQLELTLGLIGIETPERM